MLRLLPVLSVAVTALAIAGCQAFGEKSYKVPSPAMEPTLHVGAHITADTDRKRPKIGDIVVFHAPRQGTDETLGSSCGGAPPPGEKIRRLCAEVGTEDPSSTFVKRVVAIGGDTVALRGGTLVRNGRTEREPYIKPCTDSAADCELPAPVTLPPGTLYVLGDNRGESADSRYWGPIRQEWVIGTVER